MLAKKSFYLGNIAFKKKRFADAVAHYKQSLRFCNFQETKNNLVLARQRMLELEKKNNQNNISQNKKLFLEAKLLEEQSIEKN